MFWKDIDVWLQKKFDGDVADQEDKYAILNSVYNILTTHPGTRRMLPTFALDIRGLLFEPIDDTTASQIKERIFGALIKWEPRIKVNVVNVTPEPDNMMFRVHITFEILTTMESVTLNYPLKREQ